VPKLPTIGELRNEVTLQTRTTTVMPSGEKTLGWVNGDTLYAAVTETSGSEQVGQMETQGETSLTIWIRYRSDVTEKGRLLFAGAVCDIESAINPDGLKIWHLLTCRRRDS